MSYYFAIVGHNDNPLFEQEFSNSKEVKKEDHRHLNQFIGHAALDLIDEHKWKSNATYLKCIDKFNQFFVSAFVTASHIRFVMVHDVQNDTGIKNFFNEMFETFIKLTLNPFYEMNTKITATQFEKKARYLLSKLKNV